MARIAGTNSDETRQRILDAARVEFDERSYAGTTIRHIADRAGVTTAALYYHFVSKEALLEAVVAPAIERLSAFADEAAAAHPCTQERMAQLIHRLVGILAGNVNDCRVLIRDPSALKALGDGHRITRIVNEVERALANSDDPLVLLRYRCAVAAIQGGFVQSARARDTAEAPEGHVAPVTFTPEEHAVVADAALAVIVCVSVGACAPVGTAL